MSIIAIVLSSLALLTATIDFGLILYGRRHSQKQNTALMAYVDASADETLKKVSGSIARLEKTHDERISDLERGAVPDFEKAKAAADAVNNFNAGISGILGYDPFAALQAQREQDLGGDKP